MNNDTHFLLGAEGGESSPSSPVFPWGKSSYNRREAAKREAATAEMGRRVLRYLFRARHDEGLKMEEV